MGDRVDVELLYNAVKTEVKCQLSWSSRTAGVKMWSGKPHQAEGAWGPDELGSREDADKMQ